MIWDSSVAVRAGIEPDFMTARGLTVELESTQLQFSNNLSVSKA
jgi:hypothetical protein